MGFVDNKAIVNLSPLHCSYFHCGRPRC